MRCKRASYFNCVGLVCITKVIRMLILNPIVSFSSWIANMTAQVTSDRYENNETDLEGMLSKHHELKTEIDTMHKNFENLETSGENLLHNQHYAEEMVKEKLEELHAGWSTLLSSWDRRTEEIQEQKKAENMSREVSQLEAWLLNQEAELSLNEVGSGLDDIEDLLKRHDEMERMLLAQEERFLALIQPMDDDERGRNVAREDTNQEDEVSDPAAKPFHSNNFSANPSYKTDENSELFDLNGIPKPLQPARDRSLESDDISPSNNHEMSELPELNSTPGLPMFFLQGERIKESVQSSNLNSAVSDWTEDQSDDDANLTEEASIIIDEIIVPSNHSNGDVSDMFQEEATSETLELKLEAETGGLGYESTKVFDEPTSTTAFDKQTNSLKPCNTNNVDRELMLVSQRILGVSPLCSGVLQRKQETDVSGQRSVAQPWRSYYTVLSEDILQFFKDLEGFKSKWHVSKPMSLVGAFCEKLLESSRQGSIFRIVFRDKSEYLFKTENEKECKLWVTKVNSVIKMAARYSSCSDSLGYHGDKSSSHDDDGQYVHYGTDAGCNSGDLHSDKLGDDNGDGAFNSDIDGRDSDDGRSNDIQAEDQILTSVNLKESPSQSSDTPMIVITDANSNNEFLVEDETLTDIYSSSDEDSQLSCDDIELCDEDAMSLSEFSDYQQPSWYPTPNSGSPNRNGAQPVPERLMQDSSDHAFVAASKPNRQTSHQGVSKLGTADDKGIRDAPDFEDSFEFPPPPPSTSATSLPDIDTIALPGKPSTQVFKANNERDIPPPVPSTPPPSVHASDEQTGVPPGLPETFPPEVTDDDLSNLLDFIPPPVLDPSFDFLAETKDEVRIRYYGVVGGNRAQFVVAGFLQTNDVMFHLF